MKRDKIKRQIQKNKEWDIQIKGELERKRRENSIKIKIIVREKCRIVEKQRKLREKNERESGMRNN